MTNFYEGTIRYLINASIEEIIIFFEQKNILKTNISCSSCSDRLIKKNGKYIDKYIYRCYKRNCSLYQKRISIRSGSFLSCSTISLRSWVEVLYRWSKNDCITRILEDIVISKPTLIKIFKEIRAKITRYYEINPFKLGGPNKTCQIDESLFCHKPKYHRGRASNSQIWVFGIVDTSFVPVKCFLKVVPDRKSSTLIPIINDICLPGTIIFSDEWASYQNIDKNLYLHDTVNHTLHFVDPESGVHTQNIESLWSSIKRKFKYMKGIHKSQLQSYLDEFMWRNNSTNDVFERLIELLS